MIGVINIKAEDWLRGVFLKALERRQKYNPSQRFTTWLYIIAWNHCVDYLSTEKYRQHNSPDASLSNDESDGAVVLDIVKGRERNQEERAMDKEIQR